MTPHAIRLAPATLVLALAATAAGETTLHRLDGWPYAGAQAVAIDGERDVAFLGSGGAVLALDITDPTTPALLHDGLHTAGHVRDLRYTGANHRLYVADEQGGLEIWDVEDVQHPARLSAVPVYYAGTNSDQPTDGLVISGDYLYINANEARVHAFNVSDPANPVDLGVQAGPLWYPPDYDRDTNDVAVDGDYVYVAGDGIAKYLKLADGRLSKLGEYLNSSGVSCLDVGGGYVYAGLYGALGVFDASEPYLPMVTSLPVGDRLTDLVVAGELVFGVDRTGLHVFDVSTPSDPQAIGMLELPRGYRVRLDGGIAYVATDASGVQVVDVGDPSLPTLLGDYDTFASTSRVTVAGQHAFLSQSTDGLVITDVSDPDSVEVAGRFEAVAAAESVLIGDYLYIADWQVPALVVLDVSDVSAPVEVGRLDDFNAARLATDGERLYVLRFVVDTQLYHLHVFDLTDPASPAELGTTLVGPYIVALEYGNDHLFAVEFYDRGVHVIDVADPSAPHEVSFYPVDWGEDIAIQGDRAYVAAFHDGLMVLDISEPTSPVELGGIHEPFLFDSVTVSGTLAFATTGLSTREVRLYDVSDPSSLVEYDRIELPGQAWDLTARDDFVYLADSYCGLEIVRAGGRLGDLDGDGNVGVTDMLSLLAAWGDCPAPPVTCPADLDGDADVDFVDLLLLLARWG